MIHLFVCDRDRDMVRRRSRDRDRDRRSESRSQDKRKSSRCELLVMEELGVVARLDYFKSIESILVFASF